MKPMLPDDREIGEESAEVSLRYRETASAEPSARIDAAILAAARREAGRPAVARNWRVPAAVAAVLVIGVSVSLLTREGIETLPPLDQTRRQAEVAKPAAPSLAMKAEPAPKGKLDPRSRPTRDRSERADREAQARPADEALVGQSAGANQAPTPAPPAVQKFEAPAATAQAPAAKEPSENSLAAQSRVEGTLENSSDKEASQEKPAAEKKAFADAIEEGRAKTLRKEQSVAAVAPAVRQPPEQWLRSIEDMIRNGRQTEARVQLAEFRKHYPDYRLPQALQAFERETAPATK